MMKSNKMGEAGRVALTGELRNTWNISLDVVKGE
jgi:hypothetical protein